MPEIKIIDDIKHAVVSLIEIDQDAIALEEFFNLKSKEKVLNRIDEVVGALMKKREYVKALTKESYISKPK